MLSIIRVTKQALKDWCTTLRAFLLSLKLTELENENKQYVDDKHLMWISIYYFGLRSSSNSSYSKALKGILQLKLGHHKNQINRALSGL